MIRVAINGLGRVGRAIVRLAADDPDLQIVAVNDLVRGDNLAYLLKFDSVHGRCEHEVECRGDRITIGDREIRVLNIKNQWLLPWRSLKVDVVIDATGRSRTRRKLIRHRLAGAKKVVITANPEERDRARIPVVIFGINEGSYDGEAIVSASSCSANCAGPIVRVLHESFTLESCFLTAVHAYTRDQELLDGSHRRDRRRGRAAPRNIVPSASDAAYVISESVPGLKGCLSGMTMRVPVPDGSLMNIVCRTERPVHTEAVNGLVKAMAEGEMSRILAYSEEPLVSKDVVNDTHSAIFDSLLTRVISPSEVRVVCWQDHEWGYAARVLDLVKLIA